MIKFRKKLLIIIYILIITLSFGNDKKITDWMEDILYLKKILFNNHPYFTNDINKNIYLNKFKYIEDNINNFSNEKINFKLIELISSINDLHTNLNFFEEKDFFPIYIKNFGKDYFICATLKKYDYLLGAKLIKINNYNISDIEQILYTCYPHENNNGTELNTARLLNIKSILQYKNIIKNKENLFVFEKNGKIIKEIIESVTERNVSFYLYFNKIPLYEQNKKKNYWWIYLENEKIIYFKINRLNSDETKGYNGDINDSQFNDITNEIFNFIKNKEIKKMIIDNRHNVGGTDIYYSFVSKLEESIINKKGKLFLIIGNNTLSAGLNMSYYLKISTNIIVIGSESQNNLNHYGGMYIDFLPNSKLKFSYSTKYQNYSKGIFKPDIYIEEKFSDYIKGKDTVIQYIINNY